MGNYRVGNLGRRLQQVIHIVLCVTLLTSASPLPVTSAQIDGRPGSDPRPARAVDGAQENPLNSGSSNPSRVDAPESPVVTTVVTTSVVPKAAEAATTSGKAASFDNTIFHTLEVAVQEDNLQDVSLPPSEATPEPAEPPVGELSTPPAEESGPAFETSLPLPSEAAPEPSPAPPEPPRTGPYREGRTSLSTNVCGTISEDTTWTPANSPYVVTCDVTVQGGVTLTIEPGVVVKFNDGYRDLWVNGTLIADGTTDDPITFTSIKDDTVGGDTNGDGADTSPAANDWSSLRFNSSSTGSVLDHVVVRYGGWQYAENVWVDTTDITLTHNTIAFAYGHGLTFSNVLPPSLSNNTFISNTNYAVWAPLTNNTDSITLSGNTATDNLVNGFGVAGTITGTVTWDGDDAFPFVVEDDLTINAGATLTLTPDTVVKFRGGYDDLWVNGTLIADTTPDAPITFTSIKDDSVGGDTNGDGADTSPAPDDWSSLRFTSSSTGSVLDHVVVRYGGWQYAENVWVDTTDITLTHNTIAFAYGHGLTFDNALPPSLSNNTFISNTNYAVWAPLTNNDDSITLSGNTAIGNLVNGFGVAGSISGTVTWDWRGDDTLPFVVESDLTVNPGATLTLTPGTVVKFREYYDALYVNGTLIADTTADAPITFTSIKDDSVGGDTNGDGSASSPAPEDWSSLRFTSSSTGSVLDHVVVRYGGGYYSENIWVDTTDITLTNNTIAFAYGYGLYFDNALPPSLSNNTFISNTNYAAYAALTNNTDSITLSGNTAIGNLVNGFGVAGSITGTVTWDWEGDDTLPFVVESDLTVNQEATLTLTPGTVVKFREYYDALYVNGTLIADTTADDPITFTSIKDDTVGGDTNGDGSASSPAPDDWSSLRFTSSSTGSVLDHTVVRYGGGYYSENVWMDTTDITLTNNAIAFSSDRGISVESASPVIEDNVIRDNKIGVYTTDGAQPTLYANQIFSNTQYGVYNADTATIVDAQYNWWGSASGPYHPTDNAGGAGDRVSDGVRFIPWLGEFAWLAPRASVVRGTERLEWAVYGRDTSTMTVNLSMRGAGEWWQTLGSDLPASGSLDWDTTGMADGTVELRAQFLDATEQVVGELTRRVLVLNTEAIEWHAGRITADETWTAARLHLLASDVTIISGTQVTILPGAVVKAAQGMRLTIEDGAALDAQGTEAEPIVFTSLKDDSAGGDTNLDGDLSQPQPGDWLGVMTQGTGQFIDTEHTYVRYFQVVHSGTLAGDETWVGGVVHAVDGEVVVPGGTVLTLEPGAVVKFDEVLGITVQAGGELVAQGNVAQPVVFTSLRDDTVGGDTNQDGDRTSPAAGDWRGIHVDGGQASFDHVVMSYGAGTASGSWDSTAASISTRPGAVVTLANSHIREAFFEGIIAWGGGDVTVTNTIIAGADRAVNSDGSASVRLINCTLDDNRIGIYGHGGDLEIANTIVANSLDYGIDNVLSSPLDIRYSNVWSTSGQNYYRHPDQTGQNGNVSVDPQFKGAESGNYRLQYMSPMIDAADGTVAPATDFMGAPRYDDPRTENTGIPTGDGAYADMGAFEFVETAESNIDLVVTDVAGPPAAMAGETATMEWTITNVGTEQAVGPWHDTVNLVLDPSTSPSVIYAGEFLVGEEVALGAGQSYEATAEVRVPGSIAGDHWWQVTTNSRGEVFEGQHSDNNTGLSLSPVTLDLPELAIGGPTLSRQFSQVGEGHWFKFIPDSRQDILVSLDLAVDDGITELYLAKGRMPTRLDYDTRSLQVDVADVQALAADTAVQTYYGLAYVRSLPGGATDFTLAAEALSFGLTGVSPTTIGNLGNVTLLLSGGQLSEEMTYEIVEPGGTPHAATSVEVINSALVYATFNMDGLLLGDYTVQASYGGVTKVAPTRVSVVAGTRGQVEINLVAPEVIRSDWDANLILEYRNTGDSDVLAPLMVLETTNAQVRYADGWNYYGSHMWILGINREGPAGILPPGGSGSINLVMRPTIDDDEIGISVGVLTEEQAGQPYDWSAIKEDLRPHSIPADAWDAIYANFTAEVGDTIGQFHAVLADNVTYLSRLGTHASDVGELMFFEFMQAGARELVQRYTLGAFGRGFPAFWEVAAYIDEFGEVRIQNGAAVYSFRSLGQIVAIRPGHPAAAEIPGGRGGLSPTFSPVTWYPAPGNDTTLTQEDGVFHWRDTDGTVTVFRPDGKLDYAEDINGNRVTAIYSGDKVIRMDFSNGDQLHIEYNAAGRVSRMIDPVGRVITCTYDAANEHLVSISTEAGTISYEYASEQSGPRQHAVTSVTFNDGTHHYFEYDDKGRLIRQYRDNHVDELSFVHDSAGGVTVSDAHGSSAELLYDHHGLLRQETNPLGNAIRYTYNGKHKVVRQISPLGATYGFGYDPGGNQSSVTDPLGNHLSILYDYTATLPHPLLAVQDARGNTTRYHYDNHGNLTAISYPDGSREQFSYDDHGQLVTHVNGRGETIIYSYSDKDLLVSKDLPDGDHLEYTYDAHRNLVTASGPMGTSSFEYDERDLVTKVTFPHGHWLAFSYDAGGRRIQMVDDHGYQVNYTYDDAGRLTTLTDGNGDLIVSYTFNQASQLTRQELGNGSYATYEYDAAGQLVQLVNYGPDDSVLSQFDYAYDALGRRTQLTTLEGTWKYGYDIGGQLVSVETPAGRQIAYQYDSAGNRVQMTDDGGITPHNINNLNQVIQVGGDSLTYDADGNLISKTAGDDTWTYTYDVENRLTEVSGPTGTIGYEYDALGHRVAMIKDGVRTNLALDPVGFAMVVGEYDATGNPVANYAFGNGLVSRTAAGATSFYHFDGSGNTVALTGGTGAVQSNYSYLPFGEILASNETVANPFRFGGQYAMLSDGMGHVLSQARLYAPWMGRFTSREPLRTPGENAYRYALNNPTGSIDPDGLEAAGTTGFWKGLFGKIVTADNLYNWTVGAVDNYVLLPNWKLSLTVAEKTWNAAHNATLDGNFAQRARMLDLYSRYQRSAKFWRKFSKPVKYARYLGKALGVIGAAKAWKQVYDTIRDTSKDGWDVLHDVGMAGGKTLTIFVKWIPLGGTLFDIWDYATQRAANWYYGLDENLEVRPPTRRTRTRVVSSRDPNDILGPGGYGEDGWIPGTGTLPYTIRFENEKSASAPAQIVRITQTLDSDLDISTFELTGYGFGSLLMNIPPGLNAYNIRLDLRDQIGLYVDVSADLDLITGGLSWEFKSVDPVTGGAPQDPLAGFLPPNQESPEGQGFVSYSIQPKADRANGTRIDAQATIIFDSNEPIDTPPIYNTIDADPPTSSVDPLPATSPPTFTVTWSGDDSGGSGIAFYDVYVSTDGGPFLSWQSAITSTQATFTGTAGSTYGFYSVATDNVGHRQPTPSTAQATTEIRSAKPGDVNGDGRVDVTDIQLVAAAWRQSPAPSYADRDGDGDVDVVDVMLVVKYWGQ